MKDPLDTHTLDAVPDHPLLEPITCACYSMTNHATQEIVPVFCDKHHRAFKVVEWGYGRRRKYMRFFDTEQDAKDRKNIIHRNWPAEGYGTWVTVDQVGRWWLVQGWWANSCD
jgi:hypothetical protein